MASKKTSKGVKETAPPEKPAKLDPEPSDAKPSEPVTHFFNYWHAISFSYWHLIQVTQISDESKTKVLTSDQKESKSEPLAKKLILKVASMKEMHENVLCMIFARYAW